MHFRGKFIFISGLMLTLSCLGLAADQTQPRLISVVGDAEVQIEPDNAILVLGLETWNKVLSAAKADNDQRSKKIQDVAEEHGVEAKDIQDSHLSIRPRYEDPNEYKKLIGYFVLKTITITIKDISKFDSILSGVLEAGINYVHEVQFTTSELRKYSDQARSLAIKAAKEKAEAMAKELGQKVGRPYLIQENPKGWNWNPSWSNANMISGTVGSVSESDSRFALGQIKVEAQVAVSFELE